MTLHHLLVLIVVGLVSGWLAALVVGGGFGIIGDIVIGVVGSFLGSWIFRSLHVGAPFGGLAGTIFVAFVGAIVLLLILRVVRGGARRRL
jgi:uncharacterized membrane protein YeaQ/YmgE (transglycosylase-associated protein family)